MQAYTRQYAYDKMGNIEQLKQTVGNTFTRNFKYNDSGSNILHSIKKADDITSYSDFTGACPEFISGMLMETG